VDLPAQEKDNAVLASLWARTKVDELMSQDWTGAQRGKMNKNLRDQVTQLGLDYRLLTQFTSFVAVEDRVVNTNGVPRTVQVPIEMPDGMDYGHVFGSESRATASPAMKYSTVVNAANGGMAGGVIAPQVQLPPPPSGGPIPSVNQQVTVEASADVADSAATVRSARPGGALVTVNPHPAVVGGHGAVPNGHVDEPKVPKPGKVEVRTIDRKLHPELVKAYDCSVGAGGSSCASELKDPVDIEVVLSSDTKGVREALMKAGLKLRTVKMRPGVVVGTIAVSDLAKLADIGAVKFAGPVPAMRARR
jgi:hypothetical protein